MPALLLSSSATANYHQDSVKAFSYIKNNYLQKAFAFMISYNLQKNPVRTVLWSYFTD